MDILNALTGLAIGQIGSTCPFLVVLGLILGFELLAVLTNCGLLTRALRNHTLLARGATKQAAQQETVRAVAAALLSGLFFFGTVWAYGFTVGAFCGNDGIILRVFAIIALATSSICAWVDNLKDAVMFLDCLQMSPVSVSDAPAFHTMITGWWKDPDGHLRISRVTRLTDGSVASHGWLPVYYVDETKVFVLSPSHPLFALANTGEAEDRGDDTSEAQPPAVRVLYALPYKKSPLAGSAPSSKQAVLCVSDEDGKLYQRRILVLDDAGKCPASDDASLETCLRNKLGDGHLLTGVPAFLVKAT